MIKAMSQDGYKYVPGEKRSRATAAIKSAIDRVGETLDEGTILDLLREASRE